MRRAVGIRVDLNGPEANAPAVIVEYEETSIVDVGDPTADPPVPPMTTSVIRQRQFAAEQLDWVNPGSPLAVFVGMMRDKIGEG